MRQKLRVKHRHFSLSEKHAIIMDYLQSGLSKQAIWHKHTGKSDHGAMVRWMRKLGYIEDNGYISRRSSYSMKSKKAKPSVTESDFELLKLQARVQELEKQLKDAEMKAIAFSTMVDIAEKEFNIPIRKKYNTKL